MFEHKWLHARSKYSTPLPGIVLLLRSSFYGEGCLFVYSGLFTLPFSFVTKNKVFVVNECLTSCAKNINVIDPHRLAQAQPVVFVQLSPPLIQLVRAVKYPFITTTLLLLMVITFWFPPLLFCFVSNLLRLRHS